MDGVFVDLDEQIFTESLTDAVTELADDKVQVVVEFHDTDTPDVFNTNISGLTYDDFGEAISLAFTDS